MEIYFPPQKEPWGKHDKAFTKTNLHILLRTTTANKLQVKMQVLTRIKSFKTLHSFFWKFYNEENQEQNFAIFSACI